MPAPISRLPGWTRPALLLALITGLASGALYARHQRHAPEAVAVVNGVPIDREYFRRRLSLAVREEDALKQMIEDALALQYAGRLGVFPRPAQVEALYRVECAKPGFREGLSKKGWTPQDEKRALLVQAARLNAATKDVPFTEAEVKHFYDGNADPKNPKALFHVPETARIAVIVTARKARAEQAWQALQKGTPFDEVARRFSEDRSREEGGVLPEVQRGRTRSRQVPGLESAIFGMLMGAEAGPRPFAGAWWIIRCLDRRPAVTLPYAGVREVCVTAARLAKMGRRDMDKAEERFAQFRRRARVQAFREEFRPAARME